MASANTRNAYECGNFMFLVNMSCEQASARRENIATFLIQLSGKNNFLFFYKPGVLQAALGKTAVQ